MIWVWHAGTLSQTLGATMPVWPRAEAVVFVPLLYPPMGVAVQHGHCRTGLSCWEKRWHLPGPDD